MSAVLRRAASRPEAAQHAEPPEPLQRLPGQEGSGTGTVRIRFQISGDAYSGRLVEVEISALVSDAGGAQVPVQAAHRELRLTVLESSTAVYHWHLSQVLFFFVAAVD
jgi:hypothetical protein